MQKLSVQQWLIAISFSLLASCQPSQEQQVTPGVKIADNNQQVVLSGDKLKFASTSDFLSTLKQLRSVEGQAKWVARFPNFTSMSASYNTLVNYDIGKALEDGTISQYTGAYVVLGQGADREYKCAVTDPSLANVLNSNGIVQVGDSLLRVSDIKVSRTHIRYEEELLAGTGSHLVSREVTKIPMRLAGSNKARVDIYWEDWYTPSGLGTRRFKGNHWAINYWLPQQYWSMGVQVDHQRRNWWGWGGHPSDGMSVTGTGTLLGFPVPMSTSSTSSNIVWRYSEPNGSSSVGPVTLNFTFTGVRNGGAGVYSNSQNFTTSI